jgi:hypothetical protein
MLCFLLRLCHIRCQFFILIIFLASSKRQVILLHIILPLLEFLASSSGRSFICCARAGLNIQFPANLLVSWRKKQIIQCQKKYTRQLLRYKLGMKYETLLCSIIAIGESFVKIVLKSKTHTSTTVKWH